MNRIQRGFTLIEVMVVVAVIAILASIAFPSYSNHVAKANRRAAQAVMHSIVSRQEQHMLNARRYHPSVTGSTTVTTPLGVAVPADVLGNYTITVHSDNEGTPPEHWVVATPIGRQLANDTRCGTLTLRSDGSKDQSGTSADCW